MLLAVPTAPTDYLLYIGLTLLAIGFLKDSGIDKLPNVLRLPIFIAANCGACDLIDQHGKGKF
jgi:hypothetical protein